MSGINNPRFPHTCAIYRLVGVTNLNDGEKSVLYEGECRKESSTNLRTFKTNNVIKADYRVALPIKGKCDIKAGDFVDVTDFSGAYTGCLIAEVYPSNLGTSIYFNLSKT
jgi:hypothetical protein